MVTNFELKLSAFNRNVPQVVHMMQFETGRQLTMTIDVDAISSAELWILRPDKTHYMATCLVNGHTIVCEIPDDFLSVVGNAICQLKLFKSDEWVNTFSFILAVEISAEGTISEKETTILTEWFANEGHALLDEWTEESKAKIEQKGQETIDSIPDDYTSLSAQVDKNTADILKNKQNADEKIEVLQKILEGEVLDFVTVEETSYEEIVGNGCKGADVQMIGGKSVVYNQLIDYEGKTNSTSSGITFTNNNDGSWTVSGHLSSGATQATKEIITSSEEKYFIPNHKYYLAGIKNGSADTVRIRVAYNNGSTTSSMVYATEDTIIDYTLVDKNSMRIYIYAYFDTEQTFTVTPTFVDLTQEFGSAIADTLTLEDCRKIFGEGYLPYNLGEIKSANVDDVEIVSSTESKHLPFPIKLNGINNSVYDYVDFEEKTYRNVKSVDLGSLTWRYASTNKYFVSDNFVTSNDVVTGGEKLCDYPYTHRGLQGTSSLNAIGYLAVAYTSGGHLALFNKEKSESDLVDGKAPWLDGIIMHYEVNNSGTDYKAKVMYKKCVVAPLFGLSWGTSGTNIFNLSKDAIKAIINADVKRASNAGLLSTKYPYGSAAVDKSIYQTTNEIRVFDSAYADVSSFTSMLEAEQVYLMYELAVIKEFDVTDLVSDIYSVVEPGGSIIYHNEDDTLHLPTLHRVQYVRKLSEVLG